MRVIHNRLLLLLFLLVTGNSLLAQVKIGGQKGSAPHPTAVLELADSTRGFLLPRLKQEQMMGIKSPANGLMVYNTSVNKIFVYLEDSKQWKPLIMDLVPAPNSINPEDSSEWVFDDSLSRVYLRRGLTVNDTIFYSPALGKMNFTDRYTYTNSMGLDFNVDQLGGKFNFKSTASLMDDTAKTAPYTTSIVKEVDNATNPNNNFHSGLLVATTVNPKATQTSAQVQGINVSSIHAGQDTVSTLSGIDNVATVNGNGYTETVWGMSNGARMSTSSHNDVGTMYGFRNTLSRLEGATGRITGNAFGYLGSFNGLSGNVDGTMYGIFLGNVQNGTTRRNYGLFTSRGLNRFGDSVLVTDNFNTFPRAVFDVNSTSAMIIPDGSTAQRPLTNVQGMLRYNNTTNNPEYNNGTTWLGLGDGGEWKFNGINSRVELTRGLPLGDSIFYSTPTHHFIFGDRTTYTNSLGSDFSADQLGGKFTFKSTASAMTDSASTSPYTTSVINEVDNASNTFNDFHSGLLVATTVNPKSTQTSSEVQGVNVSTIHAGQDTVSALSGITNAATVNGNGYTDLVWGFNNSTRISTNSHNNVGSIYGMLNTVTRSAAATGRITGDVFGYQGSLNGLSGNVDGTMYGIFLGNVQNGTTRRNYGVYTSRGLNRFGDSVLVTDNFNTIPRAVFDVNSTSAMIIPDGTTAQRPLTNVQGMLRYNSTGNNPEFNNGTKWVGINTDSSEWVYNSAANKVNMKRPLTLGDSIFYSTQNRHFVFGDRTVYTNSLGSDFTVDQLGGKFTFKSTASKGQDSAGTAPYAVSIVNEVDNASTAFNDFYSGLLVATTVNPKALQKPSQVEGMNVSSIHAGKDTVQQLSGIDNGASVNGLGYTETVTGFTSSVRFNSNARNNIGSIYGIQNNITKAAGATGHVNGNVFGYIGQVSGYAGRINGTLYGIFLNNMAGAGPRKNYGIYTNTGLNRFGDSVLITNTGVILPRAVLDINATSSMIVPTGTTAQRPATGVTGMVRYNADNGGTLETYNGTGWNGTIRNTQKINVPNIPANGSVTVSVTVPGATLGSVVYVSPSATLAASVVIASARVSATNTVEIKFNNVSAPAVNPAAMDYYIRVIQ